MDEFKVRFIDFTLMNKSAFGKTVAYVGELASLKLFDCLYHEVKLHKRTK